MENDSMFSPFLEGPNTIVLGESNDKPQSSQNHPDRFHDFDGYIFEKDSTYLTNHVTLLEEQNNIISNNNNFQGYDKFDEEVSKITPPVDGLLDEIPIKTKHSLSFNEINVSNNNNNNKKRKTNPKIKSKQEKDNKSITTTNLEKRRKDTITNKLKINKDLKKDEKEDEEIFNNHRKERTLRSNKKKIKKNHDSSFEESNSSTTSSSYSPKINTQPQRSQYRGVSIDGTTKRWRSRIKIQGQTKHIGYFATAEEAARAFDEAARKYRGAKAKTNFV